MRRREADTIPFVVETPYAANQQVRWASETSSERQARRRSEAGAAA